MKIKKIYTGIELCAGQRIPLWYGLAYRVCGYDKAVFYPIPINIFIRIFCIISDWIIQCSPTKLEKIKMDYYEKGQNSIKTDLQITINALNRNKQETA